MTNELAGPPLLLLVVLLVATASLVLKETAIAHECARFLSVRKRWWLGPIAVMLLLLGLLVVLTSGSKTAAFIYWLF
jgi:hypothetical protein